jgi:hypothetical protein
MEPFNTVAAPKKFYVIKRRGENHYAGHGLWQKTAETARQFPSVEEAALALPETKRSNGARWPLFIVRVEEIVTTQPETREVLDENTNVRAMQENQSIKYAIQTAPPKYGQTFIGNGLYTYLSLLPQATLWNTQAEALTALQHAVKGRTNIITNAGAVVRVLVTAGSTTIKFTETVLS